MHIRFILIRFFSFLLAFTMTVQYKGNSFIFQNEVKLNIYVEKMRMRIVIKMRMIL